MLDSRTVHSRAFLSCLMLLGMLGLGARAEAATFRYDPLQQLQYEDYPTPIIDGADGVGGGNFFLDSFNHVRFQVDQIYTPITKVSVRLLILHTHINDLRISLIAPDNTTVVLVNGIGAVGNPIVPLGGFGTITPTYQYVEFTPFDTPTPLAIMDPAVLAGHPGIVLPGTYLPTGNMGAFNGKVNAQANGIWRLKIEDTRRGDLLDFGTFYDARLYITQEGGERVWTGAGDDDLWSNGENWDDLFGRPDPAQSNALIFPPNAARFEPENDYNGVAATVIHTLAAGAYPISPFFRVPSANSSAQVTISMAAQPLNVRTAWANLLLASQVGDLLNIASDLTVAVNGVFRITAINLLTGTLTIVRYDSAGTNSDTVSSSGSAAVAPLASMTVTRDLRPLEISGVEFTGGNFRVTGVPVTVTDRAEFTNLGGNNEWAINSAMEAGEIILNSQAQGTLTLTGVWSGEGGFTKTGIAPVTISNIGLNTYTGANKVLNGILDITTVTALGTNAAGTAINGGTLRVAAGLAIVEPTVIGGPGYAPLGGVPIGALVFTNGGSLNGVTLDPLRPSSLSVLAGNATATLVVTPPTPVVQHQLTITNAANLAIAGELPTTTALVVKGGATTFAAAQPRIRDLTVSGGADIVATGALTVSGKITSEAAIDTSVISGAGGLNLGAVGHELTVGAGAAGVNGGANLTTSDLSITTPITNGTFTKMGGGVLRITADAAGVVATVTGGTLATGTIGLGAVSVANGAVLSTGGTLTVPSVTLASGSALILPAGAAPLIDATGAVSLAGSVLQPYSGNGTTIINAASVTGEFEGKANGAGITYNAASVVLAGGGGSWAFNPTTSFTVDESAGTLQVTLFGSGATPLLRHFGGGVVEGADLRLRGTLGVVGGPATTVTFTIPILDNFVDTGDQTTTLAIVPQDGSLITNSATLTILDNDKTDQKKCGFGTGLTVFLLLGFGLFFQLRLRRR